MSEKNKQKFPKSEILDCVGFIKTEILLLKKNLICSNMFAKQSI